MIITISGTAGSGKTTVGKELAKKLGYKFYSMGDLRGKMAQERGLTIDELNELGKNEAWTDREVDEYQTKLGDSEDNFVIDGWLSFHFIPHSIKIFLETDIDVSARRIFADQRPDEPATKTVEETKQMIIRRMEETHNRYMKYYGINYRDKTQFDTVIDTSNLNVSQIVDKIMSFLKFRAHK